MKICVFGAGAIGGYMAGELALAGHEVCAIARGAHLAAIRSHGLKLIVEGQTRTVNLPASDDPAAFGPQHVVICALKAQQAHASAGAFAPLLGPRTAVLTAMNGIPWWYFYKERGPLDGHHLESVDPGAAQWNTIGPERAIGCVVDPACEVVAPGVIEHRLFKRFTIGEPDGSPRSASWPCAMRWFRPDSMRRSATQSAGTSGSSSGATSASTRSAHLPSRPSIASPPSPASAPYATP